VFAVAVMACAAWLFLFVVLLIVPPPGPQRGDGPGGEPPAIISLLAGRLDKPGFGATLADLAVFSPGQANTAWSSYRGGWRQLEIETSTWSWPLGCLATIAIGLGSGRVLRRGDLAGHERDGRAGQGHDLPGRGRRRRRRTPSSTAR
jgi:hypothetical protein